MKSPLRLVSRKMRRHIPQLLGLILLLAVGVSFFVTLFTILMRYEETADQFFSDHNYADVTFYGVFDHESVALLSGFDGVLRSEGRVVHDFRNDEQMIRAISLTHDINTLHLDDGRLPSNQMEGVLLRQNANAMDLLIGDTIVVGHRELQITGIAYSPEYIYLVQNERNPIAGADVFGVIFVTRDFFAENDNEIVVMTDDHFDITEAGQAIGAFHHLQRQGQVNYQMYRDALEQFVTFAYIFPFIFAVLIVVITYIVLSRTIQKDRKQIGIMKALGTSNKRIIFVYLSQFFFTAIVGAMIGCTTAIFLTDIVINMFSAVFIVPTLGFAFYPALWLSATITSIILCVLSSWIALLGILQVMPAHAMSPRLPKGGNKIFIEHIEFLWKSFTFNTRYTLKNAFRNKGRFLVIVLGMAASCALLMFSFGFNDSIMNTKDEHFTHFAHYDIVINFNPIPLIEQHPVLEQLDDAAKVLMMPVEIEGENYNLAITENDFDMVAIPVNDLQNGIIIPEYFASRWGVDVGDPLYINEISTIVSAIIPQFVGLTLFTSFDYFIQVAEEFPAIYNTIFGRTTDFSSLNAYLMENNIQFSTIDEDKVSFDSIMESFSVLVVFLTIFSIILGFTVLYSVGLINLSAREYEYMFMGVMGYSHKSILTAHIKESILQLILAVPTGFILGNVILKNTGGEFSSNSFVMVPIIFPQTYVISAVSIIGITVLMIWVTSRQIGKLDIVEGLKEQGD